MAQRLQQGILSLVTADEINRLEVEFKKAAASSLDYEIQGDFKGSAADRYEQIQRLLTRILVESCNEHGWVIPFTQLTVHQA